MIEGSIVDTSVPLTPEQLSAMAMKQQENYEEFLVSPKKEDENGL